MKYCFLFFIWPFLLLSCAGEPKIPQKYFGFEFYLRYDETGGHAKAEATVMGAPPQSAPMEIADGIRFQKKAMKIRPVKGLTYECEFAAAWLPSWSYEWTDEGGKQRSFTVPMPKISDFGFGSDRIARDKAAVFKWNGDALGQGETFVLIWEKTSGETIPMELYTLGTQTEINFPAAKMSQLSAGDWSLYVVRKKLVKTAQEGVSFTAVSEFYSKSVKIKVF